MNAAFVVGVVIRIVWPNRRLFAFSFRFRRPLRIVVTTAASPFKQHFLFSYIRRVSGIILVSCVEPTFHYKTEIAMFL